MKVHSFMLIMYRKYERWQTNENLRRHSLVNCRQVICIITRSAQQYRWQGTSTWRGREKKSNTDIWRDNFFSFRISSQQASILTIPYLAAAAYCSFKLMSSNTLMRSATSLSSSVKFTIVLVLSLGSGSGSGSSASSKALRFWVLRKSPSVSFWSRKFSA
jgi:hypothetical protein